MPETTTESEVFKILFQKISVAEDLLDYEAVTTLLQLCAVPSTKVTSLRSIDHARLCGYHSHKRH